MALCNRGLYLDDRHRLELRECPVPEPGEAEVLIRIKANGICGSDIHFFKDGRLGNFKVTRPYIPGHEASGVIVGTGRGVKGFADGDRVIIEPGIACGHCSYCRAGRYNLCPNVTFLSAPPVDGTFRDYVAIPASFVHRMPDGMDFETAAVAEPAAVAVHAVNRAAFANGASGVIIGAGPIGLLTLQAFKAAGGGHAVCVDMNKKRLALAAELGADETVDPAEEGMPENAGDVVFETAGAAAATGSLFSIAKTGGTVVQVGWPNGNEVKMNIAEFLDKELNYFGVNRYANAFPAAIQWLSDKRIDAQKIISHRFPFSRADEAFSFAAANSAETVKVIVIND